MHAHDQNRPGTRCGGPTLDRLIEGLDCGRAGGSVVLDLAVGPFWAGVRTTLGTGMASTLWSEGWRHGGAAVAEAGSLSSRSPLEIADMLRSASTLEAAIGLAAVNALLPPPSGRVDTTNAFEVLVEHGGGLRVAVIGHFPFVDRLRPACRELWVFERGNGLGPGDLGPERMPELMPGADVVAVTATTLINHTLDEVLRHRRPEALWLMLGPSTPFAPPLLELGFDALCGTVVEDPEAALRAIREGATARQIPGCRRVVWWGGHGD
jgi:uncharacterized protein